jgi:hypothetical protein
MVERMSPAKEEYIGIQRNHQLYTKSCFYLYENFQVYVPTTECSIDDRVFLIWMALIGR